MTNRGHQLGIMRSFSEVEVFDVLERSGRLDKLSAYMKRAILDIIMQEKLFFYHDSVHTSYRYALYEEHFDQAVEILKSDMETLNG